MLVSLKFSNFYSFFEEAELSMLVSQKPRKTNFDVYLSNHPDLRINKVTTVVGPNGSGKTQFLKTFGFLNWFISDSFMRNEPRSPLPYDAHEYHKEKTSKFEFEFIIGKEHYRYNLEITTKEVIHESLHVKTSRQYSYIFIRDKNENGQGYSFKQKKFGLNKKIAEKTRANASIISTAYAHDVELASSLVEYVSHYAYNMNFMGRDIFSHQKLLSSAKFFYDNPNYHSYLKDLICKLDFGISSIDLSEIESVAESEDSMQEKVYLPVGEHSSSKGTFSLPFFDESSGTQSAYVLFRKIIPILHGGGVAVLDELDNALHPHMLEKIIDLFRNEDTNPFNAQLIFSCHTPEALNLLSKHQVYIVEKHDLESEAYRLDEVQGLRWDDNLYAKYLAGALGGIPDL